MTSAGSLNRDLVLRAAVALADEDGIESLSMRKLGQRLGKLRRKSILSEKQLEEKELLEELGRDLGCWVEALDDEEI